MAQLFGGLSSALLVMRPCFSIHLCISHTPSLILLVPYWLASGLFTFRLSDISILSYGARTFRISVKHFHHCRQSVISSIQHGFTLPSPSDFKFRWHQLFVNVLYGRLLLHFFGTPQQLIYSSQCRHIYCTNFTTPVATAFYLTLILYFATFYYRCSETFQKTQKMLHLTYKNIPSSQRPSAFQSDSYPIVVDPFLTPFPWFTLRR